jgi:hypothetical protein
MDLDVFRSLAELAFSREESGDQFLGADCSTWLAVFEHCLFRLFCRSRGWLDHDRLGRNAVS